MKLCMVDAAVRVYGHTNGHLWDIHLERLRFSAFFRHQASLTGENEAVPHFL